MGVEASKESLKKMLGLPTDVTTVDFEKTSISEIAFYLYRDTVIATTVAAHLYDSTSDYDARLSRNDAIKIGLLVRISKFMSAVLALMVDKNRFHGEVVMALNRCITESATNLLFFCEKAQTEDYDLFVKSSLKPELEQRDSIHKNISERGKELPIEKRMLSSITRVLKLSNMEGVSDPKKIPRWKDYRSLLNSLEMGTAHPSLQGIGSHSIHGTWVDLLLHHLEGNEAGFRPQPDAVQPDARLLLPVANFVLDATRACVLARFSSENEAIAYLVGHIEVLKQQIKNSDAVHEKALASRKSPSDPSTQTSNSKLQ